MASAPYTTMLSGAGLPAHLVGGKGASLDRLVGWGASVPPTGVVTTEAYRSFLAASDLSESLYELWADPLPTPDRFETEIRRIDELFLAAPMPGQLQREILNLVEDVGQGGALAVRSSATAEDMSSASFAGQYRSFLDAQTTEEILRAVRLVWASLWLPAARSYRRFRGIDESDLAMAVVMMRLVDADLAGVVFTVDPGGREDAVRVEVVEGLGEQLVSGAVTPAAHVVSRSRPRSTLDGTDPILDEVVDTALGVEAWFGSPQDVEWAYDGSRLYLVQARPITTKPAALGDDDGFDTEPAPSTTYTTAGIAEMVPGLLPPLLWTTVGPLLEESFLRLFDHLGTLPEDLRGPHAVVGRFRSRAALNLDLIKRMASDIPGGSGDDLERQYFGRVISEAAPGDRATATRGSGGVRSMLRSVKEIRARAQFAREAEIVIGAVDQVLAARVDIPALPVDELIAYRGRLLDLAGRALAAELAVAAAAAAAYRGIELFLEPRVHPGEAGLWAQRLTSGGMHTCGGHMAFSVCDLIRDSSASDALAASLTTCADHTEIRRELGVTLEGRRLLERLDELLRLGGSAAIFAGPTWIEEQDLVWQMLRQVVRAGTVVCPDCGTTAAECRCGAAHDVVRIGGSDDRARAFSELERWVMRTWSWRASRVLTGQIVDVRKRMLRRMATDAFVFLDRRERSKTAVLRLGGEVRRVHVELGKRLAGLGLIESPTDADFLASAELDRCFAGAGPTFEMIARRRRQHDQAAAGGALPQIFTGRPRSAEAQQLIGDSFAGWGGSPGRYRGSAHVIHDPTEPFERGEVMVARTTDPSWTPLFLAAGAIVVEEGGPLSHAAIVARELGVPAVLNIPGITKRLEGRATQVTVDGTEGTVTIHATQGAPGEIAA